MSGPEPPLSYFAISNSAYWTRHPYVGLGPAAHSFDGTARSWNTSSARHSEILTEEEAKEEEIMLGLRTALGIPEGLVAPERAEVMFADGRLARLDGGRLRIPEDHWFVSDDIIADLI